MDAPVIPIKKILKNRSHGVKAKMVDIKSADNNKKQIPDLNFFYLLAV